MQIINCGLDLLEKLISPPLAKDLILKFSNYRTTITFFTLVSTASSDAMKII